MALRGGGSGFPMVPLKTGFCNLKTRPISKPDPTNLKTEQNPLPRKTRPIAKPDQTQQNPTNLKTRQDPTELEARPAQTPTKRKIRPSPAKPCHLNKLACTEKPDKARNPAKPDHVKHRRSDRSQDTTKPSTPQSLIHLRTAEPDCSQNPTLLDPERPVSKPDKTLRAKTCKQNPATARF